MVSRPELTLAGIIDATLALARRIGFDAVSLRPLAAELNVTPTALYYHVRNKEELLDAVVSRIFASMEPPNRALPWTERMRLFVLEQNALFQAYPGLARFLVSHSQSHVARRRMSAIHEILRDGGFRGERLEAALAVFAFYTDPTTLTAPPPEGEEGFVIDVEGVSNRKASACYRLGLETLLASFDRDLEPVALEQAESTIGEPVPPSLRTPITSPL